VHAYARSDVRRARARAPRRRRRRCVFWVFSPPYLSDSSPFYAMGAFLDKPNVEKTTSAETNGNLLAGVSAMQGARRELGGRGSPARHALLPTAHALPATPFALAGWRVDMEVRFGGSPHRAARCGAALPHRAPRALRATQRSAAPLRGLFPSVPACYPQDAHTIALGLPGAADVSFFAVYDGHGGALVSSLASQQVRSLPHTFCSRGFCLSKGGAVPPVLVARRRGP